jgi:hypothetical protein
MNLRERRSGNDSRSEAEKQSVGERRSGMDRRSEIEPGAPMPSNEQLALFVRRIRRTMRDERGRSFLGVATAENDFALYPDVVRVVDWIEHLIDAKVEDQPTGSTKPTFRKAVRGEAESKC